mmetsp:Transcript_41171/g.68465  ORF Transcript_41171/g.68465 Transcript_41171/m.68465 type:complete len:248 (-) Transcript_41171:35-778(-)
MGSGAGRRRELRSQACCGRAEQQDTEVVPEPAPSAGCCRHAVSASRLLSRSGDEGQVYDGPMPTRASVPTGRCVHRQRRGDAASGRHAAALEPDDGDESWRRQPQSGHPGRSRTLTPHQQSAYGIRPVGAIWHTCERLGGARPTPPDAAGTAYEVRHAYPARRVAISPGRELAARATRWRCGCAARAELGGVLRHCDGGRGGSTRSECARCCLQPHEAVRHRRRAVHLGAACGQRGRLPPVARTRWS